MRSYESWIWPDLPMHSSYVDSGSREKICLRWRNHHLGKIRLHILHHTESYVIHIPPLCSWFFIFSLKLAHNFICNSNLCSFPLYKISSSSILLASKRLRTLCTHNHTIYASIAFAEEPVWLSRNQSLSLACQVHEGVKYKGWRFCSLQSLLPINCGKSYKSCWGVLSSDFSSRLQSGSAPWVQSTSPYQKASKTWSARKECWPSTPLSCTSLLLTYMRWETPSKSRSSCPMGQIFRCLPLAKGTWRIFGPHHCRQASLRVEEDHTRCWESIWGRSWS